MDIPVRVEWQTNSRTFVFELVGESALLRLPEGNDVRLNNADWHALAKVIAEHVPAVGTRNSSLAKAGRPWTGPEEQELRDSFRKGVPFSDIARNLQRSRGAIGARLVRIGLLADRQHRS